MRQDKLPPAVSNAFICRPTMLAVNIAFIYGSRPLPMLLTQRPGWNVVPERGAGGQLVGRNILVNEAKAEKFDSWQPLRVRQGPFAGLPITPTTLELAAAASEVIICGDGNNRRFTVVKGDDRA